MMVLRAKEHDHVTVSVDGEGVGHLDSGHFELNRPALFFNTVPSQPGYLMVGGEPKYAESNRAKLYGLHYQHWPDTESSPRSSLISYPGYMRYHASDTAFFRPGGSGSDPWKATSGGVSCPAGQQASDLDVMRHRVDGLFVHSLDVASGSSGGGVLSRPYWWGKDLSSFFVRHFGSPSFRRATFLKSVKGVFTTGFTPAIDPSDPFDRAWQPYELPDEGAGDPGGNPLNDADGPGGTWLNEQAAARAGRDHAGDGTPDDPAPYQDTTSVPGPAVPSTGAGVGLGIEPLEGVPSVGDDPGFGELGQQIDWANNSANGDGSPNQGPTIGAPHEAGGRQLYAYDLTCDDLHYGAKRYSEGYAIGLFGSRTYKGQSEEEGLHKLGVVCSPWSARSWSDNWRFLRVVTQPWFETDGYDRFRNSWGGSLKDFLVRAYLGLKAAEAGAEYPTRPAPLKTCPPNYALNGLELYFDVDHGEPRILGVKSLRCACVKDEGGPQLLSVPTVPAFPEYLELDVDFGISKKFVLRQDIGLVEMSTYAGNPQVGTATCSGPNQIITKLQVHRVANTHEFVKFIPYCRARPT